MQKQTSVASTLDFGVELVLRSDNGAAYVEHLPNIKP